MNQDIEFAKGKNHVLMPTNGDATSFEHPLRSCTTSS
jgi:hypothetical protein